MARQTIRDAERRLEESLASCAAHFRRMEDAEGLEALTAGAQDLQHLLDLCRAVGEPAFSAREALVLLREVRGLVANRDITGLADVLEYRVCPVLNALAGKEEKA